ASSDVPSLSGFSSRSLHDALPICGRRGIERLYSHQAQAIDAALGGQHVVIATPTSSGKSLCFHLPVLDAIARDPSKSALYLYPTDRKSTRLNSSHVKNSYAVL